MMTILIKSKKIISINDGDNNGIYKGDIIGKELEPPNEFLSMLMVHAVSSVLDVVRNLKHKRKD